MSTPIGNNGTTQTNAPTDTMGPNAGTSASDLQSTFLKLLITQLQNQDPTSPMDSSQMTSQLAQIDTVSGIAQLNQSLGSLSAQLSASEAGQAASLVGRTVLVPGNTFTVAHPLSADGTPDTSKVAASPFGIKLPAATSDLKLQVVDSNGNVVNTIDLGQQPAGVIPVPSFKAVDAGGKPLPTGNYTFNVVDAGGAATGDNAPVPLTGFPVIGVVTQADGTPGLTLQTGQTIPLNGGASAIL
ncbi:flagellar hook assembly protein FlgD [Paraburkholderia sp. SARCC-3016]|uniref:flagellar hook assembly protein FlgD n=1 Tax=Paraburkholderia sp. SARCC-3016 TaxID=3058611 RepID=UPI002807957E|nr:flagellar hook assembly protein FlgD [Paraburkholderia sp. SARCC-3016]MDQ7979102.1 flagellar hook assembly protein FlgD [Paraburkholderia sp. SARCC-3016]